MKKILDILPILFVIILSVALLGYVTALVMTIVDAPTEPITVVSPPFNTPIEDTAHYVTVEGVLIHADN